jgi:hypothetical protein
MSVEPAQWMKDISQALVDAMQCAILVYQDQRFQEMTPDQQVGVMTGVTHEYAARICTIVVAQLSDQTSS